MFFTVFVSALQFVAIVNALIRSLRERFAVGTFGGIFRGALLIAGGIGALWVRTVHYPGSEVPAPVVPTLMALAATFLGPLVSFAVITVAHRRKRDAPASQEERLSRPFKAWLPVALFDAAFVVIHFLAVLSSNPF